MDKIYGIVGQLREVEDQLIKDLKETTVPTQQLAKKYGVSRQAIFDFIHRKNITRPKREHTEKRLIRQRLIRIAKKHHSDFISSRTIKKTLGIRTGKWLYHRSILRKKGLISQNFGRLRSERVEQAYQIYFEKRLPVKVIGKLVGFESFGSIILNHKASGWDVPAPLFKYDGNAHRDAKLNMMKRKKKG